VLGPTVSLCVTSRDPVPPNWENVPSAIHFCRLDYEAGYTNDLPNNLAAETIATWNADSGDLRMVKIPQTRLGRITVQWLFRHCNPHSLTFSSQHSADFQYISPHKIVLASGLAFHPFGAVLCAFSTNAEDEEEHLQFYQGEHTDPDGISHNLGRTSSSTPGPIIVHNHDSGNRITIFKSELLLGDIPVHFKPLFHHFFSLTVTVVICNHTGPTWAARGIQLSE
jgi:hypothetical protein